jgi:hypothetical protein
MEYVLLGLGILIVRSPIRNAACRRCTLSKQSPSFKDVLISMLKRNGWAPADRAHLKRWADRWIADPVWEKIAADVRKHSRFPEPIHETIIREALFARGIAEGVKAGNDPFFQERQRQRSELFALAEKADDLAKYFESVERYSGIAMFFYRFFLPVRSLRMFHEYESRLLRQRAGQEPQQTTRISKQRHRREYVAFMVFMEASMRECTSRPFHGAIATMTEIAFPKAGTLTAEDVRKACGPTTRSGRRNNGRYTQRLKR